MPELQQPDIVGNFLSSYGTAQAQQQAQKDRAFQQQRVMRQDDMAEQQFGMQKQKHQFEIAQQVVDMLGSVQDGDEMGFERAKQRWGQMGLPMEAVAGFTVADLPSLRVKAGTQLRELQAQAQQANIRQSNAAAAASDRSNRPQPGGGLGGLDNKTFDNISGLRKEFQGATKDFGAVRDAYGRIKATSGAATPAGDISMIYAYMKMLDPTSVVRESEFSIAQNARPLLDRMGLSWDAVKSAWQGQKLQPEVRRDFLNQASSLYKQQLGQYENTKKQYGGLAQRFGFDPALVLTDQTGGLQPDEQAPPPGDAPPPAANGYTVRKVR